MIRGWPRSFPLLGWALLGVAWGAVTPCSAHNPDTSYARINLASNRLELRLTYDVFTLLKIAPLDGDGDRNVTRHELDRAVPAIRRFLRDSVFLEINGESADLGSPAEPAWPSEAGEAIPAADWHTANGLITFPFLTEVGRPREVALEFTFWEILGLRHTVLGVFEARGVTQEVTFTREEPDYLYDVFYEKNSTALSVQEEGGSREPERGESLPGALGRFLRLGVDHIFLGYDHIFFLLALLVVSRLGEMVKIITSFTGAHSLTLIAAALGWVRLPGRWVECAIALTIVYVAVENLWRKEPRHRWMLTFGFGLIHGFGFAGVLAGLGLPAEGTLRCLLSFNVGVELGQLVIVVLCLPLVLALRRWRYGRRAVRGVSVVVAILGLVWFVERLFDVRLM